MQDNYKKGVFMQYWIANNFEEDTLEGLAKEIARYSFEADDISDIRIKDLECFKDGYIVEAAESTRVLVEKDSQKWLDHFFENEKNDKDYDQECGSLIYDRL